MPAGRLQIEVFPQLSRKWAVGLEPRQACWSLDPESAVQGAGRPSLKSAKLFWAGCCCCCTHGWTALLHLPSLHRVDCLEGVGKEPLQWGCISWSLFSLKCSHLLVLIYSWPKSVCPENEYTMSSSKVKDSAFMPYCSRVKIANQGRS